MPTNWTICAAYMLKDWPSPKMSGMYVWENVGIRMAGIPQNPREADQASLEVFPSESGTTYYARYKNTYATEITTEKTLFPGKWIRSCLSYERLESNEGKLRLVVDGSLVKQEQFVEERHQQWYGIVESVDEYRLILGNGYSRPISIQYWDSISG